jgi:hypothetical protein
MPDGTDGSPVGVVGCTAKERVDTIVLTIMTAADTAANLLFFMAGCLFVCFVGFNELNFGLLIQRLVVACKALKSGSLSQMLGVAWN